MILTLQFTGCFYLWGNVSVYFASYFYQYDPSITIESTYIMIPLEQLGHMSFNPLTAHLYHKIGPQLCIIMGSSIALTGLLISSYMTNFTLFVLFYGGFFGVGIGLSYLAPLMCCWEHFPNRRGMVSGIIIGGFGFATFIFDVISMLLVNPEDLKPSIQVKHGDNIELYFEADIANRAPVMLRYLICIWLVMIVISLLLIKPPARDASDP